MLLKTKSPTASYRQQIVPSAYGCGFQIIEEAEIEKPRPDPKADQIKYRDLLAAERWTPEHFEREIQPLGFPAAVSRTFSVKRGMESVFLGSQIADWKTRLKKLAAKL